MVTRLILIACSLPPPRQTSQSKLYVSLSSGQEFGKTRPYPVFTRWSYHNIINGFYLCIEDPMYRRFPKAGVTWFFGTKNDSYVDEIKLLIVNIVKRYQISYDDVYFIGSSQGGSIALMLGNLINNTNVFAMNPQYDPAVFSNQSLKFFMSHLDVDIRDKSLTNFNFIPNNSTSRFFICTNCKSKIDLTQLEILSKIKVFPIRYGVHQYDNLTLWNHLSSDGHSTFPEKLLFVICLYYVELIKNNISLNEYEIFNTLISEVLYKKYSLLDQM